MPTETGNESELEARPRRSPHPRATTFRDLIVWQRAMELIVAAYFLSRRLPASERFGMSDQLRRATVSIASNIAEGHGRTHRGDFLHHLSIARGSVMEVETLLIAAERLEFAPLSACRECRDLAHEVGRMLTAMIRTLREKPEEPRSRPASSRTRTEPAASGSSGE